MNIDENTFIEGDRATFFVFLDLGKEPVPIHNAKISKVDLSIPRIQLRAPTTPGSRRQWNFNRLRLSTPVIVTSSHPTSDPPEDVRYFKANLLSRMGRSITLQPYEEVVPKSKTPQAPPPPQEELVQDPIEPTEPDEPVPTDETPDEQEE